MESTKGIYIEALHLGVNNLNNGISYNQVIQHLSNQGYQIEKEFFGYFHRWFYLNYFHESKTVAASYNERENKYLHFWNDYFTGIDDKPCIIMADGYMKYMEYQELEQARQSSKKAQRTATIAIIITGIFAIVSIILEIYLH